MKISLSAISFRSAWQNNRPFVWLLLCLLLLHSILKILFYYYNHQLLFGTAGETGPLRLIKWSLAYDVLLLLAINTIFLFLLQVCRLLKLHTIGWWVTLAFAILNAAALLLNVLDIFYYRFRFQRASSDLLYVVDHPVRQVLNFNAGIILLFVSGFIILGWFLWFVHRRFHKAFADNHDHILASIFLLTGLVLLLSLKRVLSRYLLPAYPLVELRSNELPVVQNSAHTFAYSVFRGGDEVLQYNYITDSECDSVFPVKKRFATETTAGKKNIVLFIMESIPCDFFDSGIYKVTMPFFDSLLQRSTFFKNAFCFTHESNKGITAILAGIPTLTDMPLYHSPYVNMPVTGIGTALKKRGYTSLFCIGDKYDNFGFAKCANWLGIEHYYCESDVPGYKNMEHHPMGLHDQYTLPFFHQKVNEAGKPFLAIHYNISTHYSYDLPSSYKKEFPGSYTAPMRSMQYYDKCLGDLFNSIKTEPWFNETLFIFCSDHWLVPDDNHVNFNSITGYRIPLILYDPKKNAGELRTETVSQFDVMGTMLAAAGDGDSAISYGGNLLDSTSLKGLAFSKKTSSVYQVIDSNHVLGFNAVTNQAEYLFNYKKDPGLKQDLSAKKDASPVKDALLIQIRSFIQKTAAHYKGRPLK